MPSRVPFLPSLSAWMLVLLVGAGPASGQQIYKCVQPDGRTLFSGNPCPKGSKAADVKAAAQPAEERPEWPCTGRARLTLKPLDKPDLTAAQAEALEHARARQQYEGMYGELLRADDGTLHFCFGQFPDHETRIETDGTIRFKRGEAIERVNLYQTAQALLARCTGALLGCRDAGVKSLSLDQCFGRVAVCQTDPPELDPAVCCPRRCHDAYRTHRDREVPDTAAFFETFHGEQRCLDPTPPAS